MTERSEENTRTIDVAVIELTQEETLLLRKALQLYRVEKLKQRIMENKPVEEDLDYCLADALGDFLEAVWKEK